MKQWQLGLLLPCQGTFNVVSNVIQAFLPMNIKSENIPIEGLAKEPMLVSLKWLRGASRYNNGASMYGRKYQLRLIMGWASQKKSRHKVGNNLLRT